MSSYKTFLDALKQGKTLEYDYFQDLSDPFNGYYTRQKLCRFTYIPDTDIVAVYESEEVFQDMDRDFGEKKQHDDLGRV